MTEEQIRQNERHACFLIVEQLYMQAVNDYREEIMQGTGSISIKAAKLSAVVAALSEAKSLIRRQSNQFDISPTLTSDIS